jgi:hypothetical protein
LSRANTTATTPKEKDERDIEELLVMHHVLFFFKKFMLERPGTPLDRHALLGPKNHWA